MVRKNKKVFECLFCQIEWNSKKTRSTCPDCALYGDRVYMVTQADGQKVYKYENYCDVCLTDWHSSNQYCRICTEREGDSSSDDHTRAHTQKNPAKDHQKKNKEKKKDKRMFGCITSTCNGRRWSDTDSISKCSGCGIEYKAIPKEDESGVGRFNCKCGHVFNVKIWSGELAPCYKCGQQIEPSEILARSDIIRRKRSKNEHKCTACNGKRCPHYDKHKAWSKPV